MFRPKILDSIFQIASTHTDGDVILWRVLPEDGGSPPIGERIDSMQGHNDKVLAISFSPTGRIASGDFLGRRSGGSIGPSLHWATALSLRTSTALARHCAKFPTEAGPMVDAVYTDAQRD